DTTTAANGSVRLGAFAAQGITHYWASPITVTVNNGAPPAPPATTSTTTVPATPPTSYSCTEGLGFSQTGMWYLSPPLGGGGFEPRVGDSAWQLRAYHGAGVSWQDPNFTGWGTAPYSPCTQHSTNPDRVLLTISTPSGIPTVAWWVTNIQAEIATIRAKYS